jgi:alkanesulfonate monooxygenase SsuD/methylene tetrahydromethanopterin reductase-like flavin-dependent oxidoreductase (luciferase family)
MPFGDARQAADLAKEAEAAGWDGFFVWEPVWGVDAWVSLTAAAMLTNRIRLGTMLTPISRIRPWELASKTATLDNLSGGRVTLAVGLGAVDTGFPEFGEETDIRVRAELMDEGLDILTGLWKGQPFNYDGKHYTIRETAFSLPPPPVQQPRIPIWVVGVWPRMKSMRRVLRYDGLVHQGGPETLPDIRRWIDEHRESSAPFEYVVEGKTPGQDAAGQRAVVEPWAQAGATWYNEANWELANNAESVARIVERIRQGPPRV